MDTNNILRIIEDILQVVGALYGVAVIIVKWTPTKADDEFLGRLQGLFKIFLAHPKE